MDKHPLCYRLISLRKEHGLKQSDISALFGMTEGAYRHYESGRGIPNALQLEKIAAYYEVSTDFLLGRDKTYDQTERAELANLVQTLPADKVTALLTVARAMKD